MEFDEIFRELDKALVERREITCIKQQIGRKIRWIIEIEDPRKSREFESRIANFLRKIRGGKHA